MGTFYKSEFAKSKISFRLHSFSTRDYFQNVFIKSGIPYNYIGTSQTHFYECSWFDKLPY